jgi:hypothetical protein
MAAPSPTIVAYQTFAQALAQFTPSRALEQFPEIQGFFQDHIAPAPPEGSSPRLGGIHLEIHKQMRLLALDVLFLQTARQATTQHQRQQQMTQRLELLGKYCQGMLELLTLDSEIQGST